MQQNIGRMDRAKFMKAHADSMYVQKIFPGLKPEDIRAGTFAYPPCWGILDAGMTMEKHKHPIPEFYVFIQGAGVMLLGTERFDVTAGMSVNIPRSMDHEVTNPESAVEPLIWVSIGLKQECGEPPVSGKK
ncbi:MAG: cupin domain-containing protein [Lentisphaerae bacterium]|nr:cupin domain-containing protein [Lentisphaerota bacterium]